MVGNSRACNPSARPGRPAAAESGPRRRPFRQPRLRARPDRAARRSACGTSSTEAFIRATARSAISCLVAVLAMKSTFSPARAIGMIALRVVPMKVRVDDVAHRLGGHFPLHLGNQRGGSRWLGVRIDHDYVLRADEYGGIAVQHRLRTGTRKVNAVSYLLNVEEARDRKWEPLPEPKQRDARPVPESTPQPGRRPLGRKSRREVWGRW